MLSMILHRPAPAQRHVEGVILPAINYRVFNEIPEDAEATDAGKRALSRFGSQLRSCQGALGHRRKGASRSRVSVRIVFLEITPKERCR